MQSWKAANISLGIGKAALKFENYLMQFTFPSQGYRG
jgi:hypothetical protein